MKERSLWRRPGVAAWLLVPALLALTLAADVKAQEAVKVIDSDPLSGTYNTVLTTITVQNGPDGLAVTPDGTRTYVANSGSNTVSVIQNSTNTVFATVPVGQGPIAIAMRSDGKRGYLVTQANNQLSVIDIDPLSATYNTVLTTIPGFTMPVGVAVNPCGTRAYIANQGGNTVSVVDITTDSPVIIATATVGAAPKGIAVTPDSSRVYVTNAGSDSVSVINTVTNITVATVGVGRTPQGIAFTPDGRQAHVANKCTNNDSVIDSDPVSPTYNTVLTTVPTDQCPYGVATTSARAYVTNFKGQSVTVINTVTDLVAATIPLAAPNSPFGVSITPNGTRTYVAIQFVDVFPTCPEQ